MRECVGDAQGASAHRVNEAPEDDDAKDRSFKAGIYVRAVGCARTPRCGQVSVCIDEAQEDPENEGKNAAAGAFSTPVERLRQKARLSARSQDTPGRRARTTRRGTLVKRANEAQGKIGGTVKANAVADHCALEGGGLSHQRPQLGIVRNRESCDQRRRDIDG